VAKSHVQLVRARVTRLYCGCFSPLHRAAEQVQAHLEILHDAHTRTGDADFLRGSLREEFQQLRTEAGNGATGFFSAGHLRVVLCDKRHGSVDVCVGVRYAAAMPYCIPRDIPRSVVDRPCTTFA
jgi:hypothetical protein